MKNPDISIHLMEENNFKEIIINSLITIQAQNEVIINYLGAVDIALERLDVDVILRQRILDSKKEILEKLILDYDSEGV